MKKILIAGAMFLSQAAMAAPVLQNASFETNNLGSSQFLYAGDVTATGWDFSGGGGVSANTPAWSGYTTYGGYFAFLQNTAQVSQSFTSTGPADYSFSFYMDQRSNTRVGGLQTVSVLLDSQVIWSDTPVDAWTRYTTSTVMLAAGSHTLSFLGTNLNAATDTTAFLDNVVMTATDHPVSEPASLVLALAGLGFAGRLNRRRLARS